MNLFLMRHGDALPDFMDPERHLSPIGREEVLAVAKLIKASSGIFQTLWHSGKPRALETAEIIAAETGYRGTLTARSGLDPGDSPEPVYQEIHDFFARSPAGHLMVVGHLPFLGILTSLLLAGAPARDLIDWPTAGLVCLYARVLPLWRLRWMITPDLARGQIG